MQYSTGSIAYTYRPFLGAILAMIYQLVNPTFEGRQVQSLNNNK